MTNKKRLLSFLLAALIVVVQIPVNALADSVEITTDISRDGISPGEGFNLTVKSSEAGEVIFSESTAFSLIDEKQKSQTLTSEGSVSAAYVYNGGDTRYITVSVNGKTKTASININNPREEDNTPPPEEKPSLMVTGAKTVAIKAGESDYLKYSLTNSSRDQARDVNTSITIDGDAGVTIVGSNSENFRAIRGGDYENVSFKIKADESAKPGNYNINIKTVFSNRSGSVSVVEDTVQLKVSNDISDFQVVVDDISFQLHDNRDGIRPGDSFWVKLRVKNLSKLPTKDIKLSLEGLNTEGFSLMGGTNNFVIPKLSGKEEQTIKIPLRANKQLKAGNHELKINSSFKTITGERVEDSNQFFIPIKGATLQNSSLILQNIKSPFSMSGNQTANVSFQLRNRGQNVARNIVITAESMDTAGLVPKTVSTIKLDSLKPNEVKDLDFSFYSNKEAPTKNYPINIKVEYVDDFIQGEDKYLLEQFLGIFVDNPQAEETDDKDKPKSTPKLIIDKYNFSADMVEAGENFDLKLSFFNTNSSKAVKNIKIFLTAEENIAEGQNVAPSGSVFTPVNSSNTFYIDSIPPKGRVEKTITMFTIPDAAAKTHVITANFEYEDSEANEYKATELIGVPVVQKSKLEVAELNYMKDVMAGEMVNISAEFYNTGKSTLYNMMVKLEGDFETENGNMYIGNFAPGTSEYFDGSIIPNTPGSITGNVVFSFEDSSGEIQEIKRPFTLNVMEQMIDEMPEDFEDMPEEKTKMQKLKWPLIIAGGILAGVFGFKTYKKKKQKKEDEDLLSDE